MESRCREMLSPLMQIRWETLGVKGERRPPAPVQATWFPLSRALQKWPFLVDRASLPKDVHILIPEPVNI